MFPVDESLVLNPVDEYDSYHGIVLKRLNENAAPNLLEEDIKKLVIGHMGLTWNANLRLSVKDFVHDCYDWFASKQNEIKK